MPTSIKIKKEDAQELTYLGDLGVADWEGLGYRLQQVHSELTGTRRWSHDHFAVFKDLDTEKFYGVNYSTGATECQDEAPFEYDGEEIEFFEVKEVQVTTTTYEVVK